MKRFHVHISVKSLQDNVDFYNKLFGVLPSKLKSDYAKWMLEDPPVNFAISSKGRSSGLNHFGVQVDSAEGLLSIKKLAENAAKEAVYDQGETTCCYAKSEKHWVLDPQGLAWEHFYSKGEDMLELSNKGDLTSSCCIPLRNSDKNSLESVTDCCIKKPTDKTEEEGCCD